MLKLLKFPGVPKGPVPPLEVGNYKIYTSVATGSWRVLRKGQRVGLPPLPLINPLTAH